MSTNFTMLTKIFWRAFVILVSFVIVVMAVRDSTFYPSHPLMMVSRRSKPNARSVTTTMGGP